MKVILLFALLGLSFYQVCSYTNSPPNTDDNLVGGGSSKAGTGKSVRSVVGDTTSKTTCDVKPAGNPKDENCLKKTLPTTRKIWTVPRLIFKYIGMTAFNKKLYYREAIDFLKLMKCSGCDLDKIHGDDGQKINLLDSTGNGGDEVESVIDKLLLTLSNSTGNGGDELESVIDKLLNALGIIKVDEKSMLKASMAIALVDMKPAMKDKLTNAICENNEDQIKDLLASLLALLGCGHTLLERDNTVKNNVNDKPTDPEMDINVLENILKQIGCMLEELLGVLTNTEKTEDSAKLTASGKTDGSAKLTGSRVNDLLSAVLKHLGCLLEMLSGTDNTAGTANAAVTANAVKIKNKATEIDYGQIVKLISEGIAEAIKLLGMDKIVGNLSKSGDGTDQSWKETVKIAKGATIDLLCMDRGLED